MKESILSKISALKDAPLEDLQKKFDELHPGEKIPTSNKTYLWRRIAYRMQELEYGGLSENAQQRVSELISEYDPINNKALRATPGSTEAQAVKGRRDRRLPIPGTTIIKNYKGSHIEVKTLAKGFEYNGKQYASLSAIAKEITGMQWNGFQFFNL
jgi:hypothetical protein